MSNQGQNAQRLTESSKYTRHKLIFESIPQLPFPITGSDDTRQQLLLHMPYHSACQQLEFLDLNIYTKHYVSRPTKSYAFQHLPILQHHFSVLVPSYHLLSPLSVFLSQLFILWISRFATSFKCC